MHETDIARTRRRVEQVADRADELVETADTITEAGYDPATADSVVEIQRQLVADLAQALADFNELTNRAETVELGRVEYAPGAAALDITHDETAGEVTLAYQGDATVAAADVTVTVAGSEATPFGGDVAPGDTATIDVSGLADGDRVEWTVVGDRVTPASHAVGSWADVTGGTTPEISVSGIDLPDHDLVADRQAATVGVTIGAPEV